MFCTSCGRAIESSARFCSNCGASVTDSFAHRSAASYTPPPPTYCATPPAGYAAPPSSFGASYPQGKLVRPRTPRMIGGVCSGVAQHYGWDVSVVRLVLVLSVLTAGFGIGLYLILWIVIPEGPYALPNAGGATPGSMSI